MFASCHTRSARLSAAFAIALVAAGCAGAPPRPMPVPTPGRGAPESETIRVGWQSGRQVRSIPFDDYVAGSLAAELGPVLLDPIIGVSAGRLQALLARTYAAANRGRHGTFDLCSTTHCQLYRPPASLPPDMVLAARGAVRETSHLAILFHGQPIQALFHSDCGGHTSSASLVWGGPAPAYLRAVPDPYCPSGRDPWLFVIDADALREALNQSPRTAVGARLTRLDILETDAANRAVRLAVDGERSPVIRGEEFRDVLTRRWGAASIRSTRFTVARAGEQFVFEGRGFGHGVGLCQAGALAQLRAGRRPEEILRMYFPGTSVGRIGS